METGKSAQKLSSTGCYSWANRDNDVFSSIKPGFCDRGYILRCFKWIYLAAERWRLKTGNDESLILAVYWLVRWRKAGARVGYCSDRLPEDVTESVVTSPQLTCKPQAWISQLYEAAFEANSHLVLQLVGQIPQTETCLIKSPQQLARQFKLEQIFDLVESHQP